MDWSATEHDLYRSGRAASGVGKRIREADVNRRLLWSKPTNIAVNGLDALRMARQNENFTTTTCHSLRKMIVKFQTHPKYGIARAIHAETPIGAQYSELA